MIGYPVRLQVSVLDDPMDVMIDWCEESIGKHGHNVWDVNYGSYRNQMKVQSVTFTFAKESDAMMFALKFMKTNKEN